MATFYLSLQDCGPAAVSPSGDGSVLSGQQGRGPSP